MRWLGGGRVSFVRRAAGPHVDRSAGVSGVSSQQRGVNRRAAGSHVKIRGFKVFLHLVEQTMLEHPQASRHGAANSSQGRPVRRCARAPAGRGPETTPEEPHRRSPKDGAPPAPSPVPRRSRRRGLTSRWREIARDYARLRASTGQDGVGRRHRRQRPGDATRGVRPHTCHLGQSRAISGNLA